MTASTVQEHPTLIRSVILYVTFITLWLLLRVLFFDRLWPVALLNTVAEYLFLPLPLFLIVSIWQRCRPSLVILGIPIVAFVVLFGELFLPPLPSSAQHTGHPITAMSFNVLYKNKDYQAITKSVRSASPDLVGFLELRPEAAQAIADALETEYPYSTLRSLGPGQSAGLLSRFPIETAEWFPLPPLDIALHTTVRVEGQLVHIFVVHLSPNNFFEQSVVEFVPLVLERYGRRAAEVTRIQEEITGLDGPILLMCDCNLTDTSEAYARLDMVLNDSFRKAGWGFGHTFHPPVAPFPIQRIDYVWHSNDFIALEAFVGQDGGSDHLPVVAKLELDKIP